MGSDNMPWEVPLIRAEWPGSYTAPEVAAALTET